MTANVDAASSDHDGASGDRTAGDADPVSGPMPPAGFATIVKRGPGEVAGVRSVSRSVPNTSHGRVAREGGP